MFGVPLFDPKYAPAAATVLTFVVMAVLVVISMWLKRWICHKDPYMKRAKRVIEELYAVQTGIVTLCAVTLVQYFLLGAVFAETSEAVVIPKDRGSLALKLILLTVTSVALMFLAAAARTRLARFDIFLSKDESGSPIDADLLVSFPRTKKVVAHMVLIAFVLGEFFLISGVFVSNVRLLHYGVG